jgi:hypothetical protein
VTSKTAVDTQDRASYCREPIRRHAVRNLVQAVRDLPLVTTPQPRSSQGDDQFAGVTSFAAERACAAIAESVEPGPAERDDLRPAIARVLERLASHTEPALVACLRRSREEWDQADSLSIIDADVADDIAALRRRLAECAQPVSSAERRAIALEGLVVLDASVALVRLFERRLAPLLRLRLRSATPDVLPGGRPFLDLGQALHEVAEAWR